MAARSCASPTIARGAIRLSSLMGLPVTYVMTHDSIGLGEDGPTHQPVEHLAMLRATPNHLVIRPADMVETAEAWEIALTQKTTSGDPRPLSRQGLPALRRENKSKNLVAQGAYVLAEAEAKQRRVILMASGSEVSIAMEAKALLEADGIGARVVSMPCMELFAQAEEAHRRRVLPAGPVRVAVEAAARMPWDRWLLGERGREGQGRLRRHGRLRRLRPRTRPLREVRHHRAGRRRQGPGAPVTDRREGRIGLYPGTFDPVTLGHLDIVRRAARARRSTRRRRRGSTPARARCSPSRSASTWSRPNAPPSPGRRVSRSSRIPFDNLLIQCARDGRRRRHRARPARGRGLSSTSSRWSA